MLAAVHAAALLTTLSLALGAQPVVLLSPDDRSLILGPIVQSVRAQLSDLPVELQVAPVKKLEGFLGAQMKVARQVAGPEGLAVVWLELSPGDPVFVYVADPRRNRVLARSVDWDGALGHLEAVGLIIRSSVQALLEGQQIGFEAPETPRPGTKPFPKQPEPEKEAGRRFHLGLLAGYSLSTPGGDAPLLHGVDAAAFLGIGENLFLTGGYRVIPSFLERAGSYSISVVTRHPFWLGVGGKLTFGRVQLGGDLSCNVDVVDLEIKSMGPWLQTSPPHEQVIVSLAPTLFAAVRLVGPLSVFLAGGVEVPLNERHYFTQGPAGRGVVLTPWEVQPRGTMGLRVDVL
ncbi:MAG TPA: hypothetical protein VGK67_17845 [Myxococcales bacterium]|jgi:hypothetical protein